jgi:hypothetical protein
MRFLHSFYTILHLFICTKTNKYDTFFRKGNGNQSASYQETIAYYKLLADFPNCEMKKMGLTDSGEPLHMVVLILKSNLILEPSKK